MLGLMRYFKLKAISRITGLPVDTLSNLKSRKKTRFCTVKVQRAIFKLHEYHGQVLELMKEHREKWVTFFLYVPTSWHTHNLLRKSRG